MDTPTEIEISRAMTGRRYYKLRPIAYEMLSPEINISRGYPARLGKARTELALPPIEHLETSIEELEEGDNQGWLLFELENRRVKKEDEVRIQGAMDAQLLIELKYEDYKVVKPNS